MISLALLLGIGGENGDRGGEHQGRMPALVRICPLVPPPSNCLELPVIDCRITWRAGSKSTLAGILVASSPNINLSTVVSRKYTTVQI